MLSRATRIAVVAAVCAATLGPAPAWAQSLGTFIWQMQPFCNVVTVTLTQVGTTYTADGFDDQCGASRRAGVVGAGVANPDGTIGIDFTIVTAPGAKGVHVTAAVNPATGHGTWVDSVGNAGAFVFGAPTGPAVSRPSRPTSSSGISPGTVGRAELAAAVVGIAQIDTTEVQTRVTGVCAVGQMLQAINADGSVACMSLPVPVVGGGPFTRTTFAFATVSPAGQAPDTLASVTFMAPVSGLAMLRARGTCNLVPQSGTENALNLVPTIGAPSLAFQAFDIGNWAIVRVPAGDPSDGIHQAAWTAERVVDVIAGQPYTAVLAGRHEAGASATDCHGSLTVVFHDTQLP